MQTALDALNPDFRADSGLELSNHIGVNSGEVIAGDASTAQRMVTGDAVNTAARLEQAAGPGEVVLGDLTYRLARDQIEVEFMPPLNLKGKAEPVPAYRLVRVAEQAAAEQAHGTPFVGRGGDGAAPRRAPDAERQNGARLMTVMGTRASGSRLVRSSRAAAGRRPGARGRCLPMTDHSGRSARSSRPSASIADEDKRSALPDRALATTRRGHPDRARDRCSRRRCDQPVPRSSSS
jgi:hypothetical protein